MLMTLLVTEGHRSFAFVADMNSTDFTDPGWIPRDNCETESVSLFVIPRTTLSMMIVNGYVN